MNDREMLEKAAKALGAELQDERGRLWLKWGGSLNVWNPLHNDGDALRLAVRLEINVLPSMEEVSARNPSHTAWMNERCDTDPNAAARRAIVRAAAAMAPRTEL